MARYVALLRGVAPTNPNMHQARLVGVLESLGLDNVRGVISSGNVIFDYERTDIRALEKRIEDAWPKMLGFRSTTILRSQKRLKKLVAFFKHPQRPDFRVPYRPAGKPHVIVSANRLAICSAIDVSTSRTPDFVAWAERQFGTDITSRTWNTVHRILKKMGQGT